MSDPFGAAFDYLLQSEGTVYTDHPRDPGGPTKYGVTQRAYSSFLGRYVSPLEIATLTPERAKVFYRHRYWDPLACGRIQDPAVAIALFDSGVLYGVGTAAILAQKALKACGAEELKFDGHIGDNSITAFNLVGREEFLKAFYSRLLMRIDSVIQINPSEEVFRKGWTNRAERLLTLGSFAPLNKEVT